MMMQNFALDLLAKLPQTPADTKKADNFSRLDSLQFKTILAGTANKAPVRLKNDGHDTRVDTSRDSQEKLQAPAKQFKTFREALAVNKEKVKAENTGSDKEVNKLSDKVDETKHQLKAGTKPEEPELLLAGLAQVFDMNPGDLMKVLQSLDIKPEDLTDSSKLNEIAGKLSQALQLNGEQSSALADIMETVKKLVEEANVDKKTDIVNEKSGSKMEKPTSGSTEDKPVSSQLPVKAGNAFVNNNAEKEQIVLSDLMAELKAKVSQLAQKLQENPQKAVSDIAEEIKLLMPREQSEGTKDAPAPDEASVEKPDPILSKEKENFGGKQIKTDDNVKLKENKKPEAEEAKTASPIISKETTVNEAVKTTNDASVLTDPAVNQAPKSNNAVEITQLHKESPVPKSEIVHQVIEKAKVVLDGQKSEMVMDLKPDNLGKLTLKVITERGMVIAKFVAESQQVKEALETNMQILKDSLEKQGLSVQGFSVSVQQESPRGFNRDNEYTRNSGRTKSEGNVGTGVAGILESRQKINPYAWSDSQINLTA